LLQHYGYLPKLAWELDAPVGIVVGSQNRPVEDRRLELEVLRVLEDVVLESGPARLVAVEVLVLGRAVRAVERVVIRQLRLGGRVVPGGIKAASEVAQVEIVMVVALAACLLVLRNPRVE